MRSAQTYNGETVWGFVNGTTGSVYVRAREHSSGDTSAAAAIQTSYEVDDHVAPAVIVRESDRRVLVYKSKHNGANVQQHISVDGGTSLTAIIASGFTSGNLDSQLGGTEYTYPTVIQLTGETNDPGYLFLRPVGGGAGQTWAYSKSTNFGTSGATPTWSALTTLISVSGRTPYPQIVQTSTTRIDFLVADGHWSTETDISLWHAYYDGSAGTFHATDGTEITLPLTTSNMTEVYDGTDTRVRAADVILSGGNPWVLFRRRHDATDYRYHFSRWNGTAWTAAVEVADDGYYASHDSDGGICFDRGDANTVYASRDVSGTMEMFEIVTADSGATWTPSAITTSSAADNFHPHSVRDRSTALKVIWLYGSRTSYTDWLAGTRGY